MINLGLRCTRSVGSRPRPSSTPGRKGSMRISACWRRSRKRDTALGDLRSRAMEDLCRVRRSTVGRVEPGVKT